MHMTERVDPRNYIITRKRKKYRFAKFCNARNCYEVAEWKKAPADVIEVGAGTGLFSAQIARRHPRARVIAIDVKGDRLQKGAYYALENNIPNVSFIRARADQIGDLLNAHSVRELWITFPDPFPKKRSEGRRLTHATFLKCYQRLLIPTGLLHLKHDNQEFFEWSKQQLIDNGWRIVTETNDLHASLSDDDAHTMTTYEQRWLGEGRKVHYLSARLAHGEVQ
jgi:tRNA (guanine-N7-)-methyltransferase